MKEFFLTYKEFNESIGFCCCFGSLSNAHKKSANSMGHTQTHSYPGYLDGLSQQQQPTKQTKKN